MRSRWSVMRRGRLDYTNNYGRPRAASGPGRAAGGGREGHHRAPGLAHVALAREEGALLDDQARGDQGALYPGAGQQLDALAPLHPPLDAAADGDRPAVDV